MHKTSTKNHRNASFHCAGTNKRNRKKGFTYFLCCGCGNSEDDAEKYSPERAPRLQPRLPPSSHPSDRSNYSSFSRKEPLTPQRPFPPAFNTSPNAPSVPVSDLRSRYENNAVLRFDGQPPHYAGISVNDRNSAFTGPRPSTGGPDGLRIPRGSHMGFPLPGASLSVDSTDKRPNLRSILETVPLYQMYHAYTKKKESKRFRHRLRASYRRFRDARRQAKGLAITRVSTPTTISTLHGSSSESSDSDDEEDSDHQGLSGTPTKNASNVERIAKDGEMQNVTHKFAGSGPMRATWASMPEVIRLDLAKNLTGPQRSLQEARFEILSSEASYFKSLTVLVNLFYNAPIFNPNVPNSVVNAIDRHQLFSNIIDICNTSENMLHSLNQSFIRNPLMEDVCDILYEHSETKLSYYIPYVKNQMYQTRTLTRLMNRPDFAQAVKNIQSMPECNFLDLHSFFVLPMQRVMRLRLLVAAVLHYTPKGTRAYTSSLIALASLENLITECNSQKGHMELKERLMTLSSQLEFKNSVAAIEMANRSLVKEGNLRLLSTSKQHPEVFKRKFSDVVKNKPTQAALFLFTDVLLVSKRKGEKYFVEDVAYVGHMTVEAKYTPKDAEIKISEFKVKVNPDDPYFISPNFKPNRNSSLIRSMRQNASPSVRDRSQSRLTNRDADVNLDSEANLGNVYTFSITFQSQDNTNVDYHLMVDTLEQRERWIDALQPEYYSIPPEISYDTWDCPQAIAVQSYGAVERDELNLKEGDLMNVIVDLSDGWLKGILPDGRQGWVPKQVCAEVDDPQARRQMMKNYLLSEEAQYAYNMHKTKPHRMFDRVQDYKGTNL